MAAARKTRMQTADRSKYCSKKYFEIPKMGYGVRKLSPGPREKVPTLKMENPS